MSDNERCSNCGTRGMNVRTLEDWRGQRWQECDFCNDERQYSTDDEVDVPSIEDRVTMEAESRDD